MVRPVAIFLTFSLFLASCSGTYTTMVDTENEKSVRHFNRSARGKKAVVEYSNMQISEGRNAQIRSDSLHFSTGKGLRSIHVSRVDNVRVISAPAASVILAAPVIAGGSVLMVSGFTSDKDSWGSLAIIPGAVIALSGLGLLAFTRSQENHIYYFEIRKDAYSYIQ